MKVFTFTLAIILSITSSSCIKNCDGADQIQHTYGYTIENVGGNDIKSQYGTLRDELYLNPQTRTEDGDRNCHLKNLVVQFGEQIDTNSTLFSCNKDLILKNKTIPAGTNLIKQEELKDFYSSGLEFVIQIDTAVLIEGVYTYFVSGRTTYGNTFTDSFSVTYLK